MALAGEMRRMSRRFIEDYDGRMAAVINMRANAAQHLTECRENLNRMAAEQQRRFNELDAHRREMAAKHRQQTDEYLNALRSNVSTVVKDLRSARRHMSAEQRKWLSSDRQRLASDVKRMRSELHADLSDARKVWTSFGIQMHERRAKRARMAHKAGKAGASAPAAAAVKKAAAPKKAPNDLTTIPGIGENRMKSLHEIGIHTFAHLAESTPQRLRQALSGPAHLVKVEAWIEEAKKRIS